MAKMGRPKSDIDWDNVRILAEYCVKQQDLATLLGFSLDGLTKRVKKEFGLTLSEFLDQNRCKLRQSLFRKQCEMALNGSIPMLIWLGKQVLDQKDQIEQKVETKQNIVYKAKWGNENDSGDKTDT